MGIKIVSRRGSWNKTEAALNGFLKKSFAESIMEKYGRIGVDILRKYTPKRTGLTAASWSYKIETTRDGLYSLQFYNSNVNDGVCIAVILQYGHGTRNGSYVRGVDYLNPAAREIFDHMALSMWMEVKNA